jgi:hypothetical protein
MMDMLKKIQAQIQNKSQAVQVVIYLILFIIFYKIITFLLFYGTMLFLLVIVVFFVVMFIQKNKINMETFKAKVPTLSIIKTYFK